MEVHVFKTARVDRAHDEIARSVRRKTNVPRAALSLKFVRGFETALAPRYVIDAALETRWRQERADRAVRGLLRERPASSARTPVARRGRLTP